MEIIKLHHPYEEGEIPKDKVVLALGFLMASTEVIKK